MEEQVEGNYARAYLVTGHDLMKAFLKAKCVIGNWFWVAKEYLELRSIDRT